MALHLLDDGGGVIAQAIGVDLSLGEELTLIGVLC